MVFNNASTVSSLNTVSFDSFGVTSLQAGVTATGCTWRSSGQVSTNGAVIDNSDFISSSDATGALQIVSAAEMSNLSFCAFTNNTKAIRITAAGTYSFNGHQFSGNTTQVDFTGTGTCTINPSNGSNISQGSCVATGGGTIVVNTPSVNLTLTGLKTNSEVRVIRVSDGVQPHISRNYSEHICPAPELSMVRDQQLHVDRFQCEYPSFTDLRPAI
jgi:hypothetical protein